MAILMAATILLDGAILIYFGSHVAGGGYVTGLDGLMAVTAILCVVGAGVVLAGLARERRFVGLAAAVGVVGLGIPLLIIGLFVLFGGMVFI